MTTLIVAPTPAAAEIGTPPETRLRSPNVPANLKVEQFAQALVLAALLAGPALMCLHAACVTDWDLWWHLRTGDWILAHGTVPRADSFSRAIAGKPWADYTWLFELLVDKLFLRFGLMGLVLYTVGMVLTISCALFHLVRRLQSDFTLVVLLSFAASFSMQHLYMPRPWLFTILFFVLVVDIVMQARRTGKIRELFWLPVIFAIWPNVHIQFVAGLVVLALALVEAILARRGIDLPTCVAPGWMLGALTASLLATCANPYGWHIYRTVYELATAPGGMDKITELFAIPFRSLPDWCVLLFAMGATAALGKAGRLLPFETALLTFAAYFSFRSQRDVWVLVVVAVAIVASSLPGRERARIRVPRSAAPLVLLASLLMLVGGFRVLHADNRVLAHLLEQQMPVKAVEAIRERGYAGPLYNDYNWGGYLMWSLRMPVNIDGRGSLYGDQAIDTSSSTWGAGPDWDSDPQLRSANMVIGPAMMPLSQVLRMESNWQLAYEDKVAAVFIRKARVPARK